MVLFGNLISVRENTRKGEHQHRMEFSCLEISSIRWFRPVEICMCGVNQTHLPLLESILSMTLFVHFCATDDVTIFDSKT